MTRRARAMILLTSLSMGGFSAPWFRAVAAANERGRVVPAEVSRARAGFISFVNSSALHPPEDHQKTDWWEILDAMHRVGMDTVILTRLEYRDENGKEWSFLRDLSFDPTERILACADDLGMQVLVGLWEDVGFDDDRLSEKYLNDAARRSLILAGEIWQRYHETHPSFGGWYIPLEPWNIGAGTNSDLQRKTRALNRFYRMVTHGLHRFDHGDDAQRMLIAVSAYFNPDNHPGWLSPAASVPLVFADILRHSGVDILMVQDGAGLRYPDPREGNDAKQLFRKQVQEYFASFARACHTTSPPVQLWGLLEVFDFDSSTGTYRSASFDRLMEQMETVSSAVPGIPLALFDFYHYMSPVVRSTGYAQDIALARGRQELYERYRTAFPGER
jgi:hypothetical protein